MRFIIPTTNLTFEIPDDWWSFADMHNFRPQATSYELPISAFSGRIEIEIVQISEIAPPWERMAIAPTLTKPRIVPILLAISSGGGLPPVQIERIQNNDYKFKLVHGFHRYCASIATGFQAIPAVFHEISWCRPDRG